MPSTTAAKLPRKRLRPSVPSMKPTRRCKFSGEAGRSNPEQTARRRSGESRPTARPALKEAGSEIASRRTETGYEASLSRASGLVTAKLSRPKRNGVDPAVVRGKSSFLTWGDLALCLKGQRREAAREVSRGSSTVGEAGRRHGAPVAGSFACGGANARYGACLTRGQDSKRLHRFLVERGHPFDEIPA